MGEKGQSMYKLCVESQFSAAHHLLEYAGPCKRIHGHNWKVKVTAGAKKVDERGMVLDMMDLKELLDTCLQPLDHQVINEIPPFDQKNPTSEHLAEYIYGWLKKELPTPVRLFQVEVFETDAFSVTYFED
jgi:6-pyruvoyltetrahydropterin/6-carboxytetrahydropterin synthase